MRTFTLLAALATAALAAPTTTTSTAPTPSTVANTTREYNLKTCLKPGQPDKSRFDNLWLYAYHTGAGLNDAVLDPNRTEYAIKGFLNASLGSGSGDQQIFDLGNPFPYALDMVAYANEYSSWEPVRINAGDGATVGGNFFINSTGLQWQSEVNSTYNAFAGWLGMCLSLLRSFCDVGALTRRQSVNGGTPTLHSSSSARASTVTLRRCAAALTCIWFRSTFEIRPARQGAAIDAHDQRGSITSNTSLA